MIRIRPFPLSRGERYVVTRAVTLTRIVSLATLGLLLAITFWRLLCR